MVATSSYRKTFQAPVVESCETGSVSRMVRYHASLSSSVCTRVADILITLRWHCQTGLTGQFDPVRLRSTVDRGALAAGWRIALLYSQPGRDQPFLERVNTLGRQGRSTFQAV